MTKMFSNTTQVCMEQKSQYAVCTMKRSKIYKEPDIKSLKFGSKIFGNKEKKNKVSLLFSP